MRGILPDIPIPQRVPGKGDTAALSLPLPGLFMFKIFKRKTDRVRQQQAKRIAELEADCEALKRVLTIKDAELDSLAAVIARDRERVKAETACHIRARTEAEILHGQLSR